MAGLAALLAACGTAPRSPAPTDPGVNPQEVIAPGPAQAVTFHALGLVGTPYRYGGNTPESGFDCSGLIAYVYREAAGIATPRTVADLSRWGRAAQ